MATDNRESDRLVPDSVLLTVLGLLAGLFVGGPVAAGLFGAFGLVVGTRLDDLRDLETELARLEDRQDGRTETDR
ncbi:hypothetical protein ACFO5R_20755 [Halosolutus amylolyticus]|uniref:Uncharacterized protein n=1 Tax=Halosolutus amylolyticus TaxID=2932267 RepID=A0ABD5PWL0_9EURY|nr:hypothetical protein [Halosolutus amylolyticus]